MKKRLLSLLLVLCMSVSLLSGISFAADSEEVWSFDPVSELLSITVNGSTTTHEVETVTGAVEDMFLNTVTIGGVTYTGALCFLDEYGFSSLAEFYCSWAGRGLLRGASYFVYDGKIVAINENAPIDTSSYAVVLSSAADESTGEATVKLGCTDGSSATYTVGYYTDISGRTYDAEEDDFSYEFANNSKVGCIVSYSVTDGKAELAEEAIFQSYTDASIENGELNMYGEPYVPTENAFAFLLYTTSRYSRNIRFKLYHLEDLGAVSASTIPVYTEGDYYRDFYGVAAVTKESSVAMCVLTYGTTTPTFEGDLSQSGSVTTPEGDPEYAVVLKSALDEGTGSATVKLGLVDGSSATYTVGYYTDISDRTYDAEEDTDFMYEFADNAKVGSIVSFKVRSDGTAALTEEAILNYGSAKLMDGAVTSGDTQYWAAEDSVLFLLYTTSSNSRNIKFKTYHIDDLPDLLSSSIPVYRGDWAADVNGAAVMNSGVDIAFASMTCGIGTPEYPGELSQGSSVTTPAGDPEHAVVLKSATDEETGAATVKLGLANGSEATYSVGYFTDRAGNTYDSAEDDSFAYEFADNSKVGYIVSFKVRSDGTAALTEEAIFNYGYATVRDGGISSNGTQYWAGDDSVLFLLYTTSSYSRNIKFKTCNPANMIDFSSSSIPVYTAGDNYKDLNGAAVMNSGADIVFASMTYGSSTPTNMVSASDVGYIVDSVAKYNPETRGTCLEVSLIDIATKKLVSGKYPNAKAANIVGYPGVVQEGSAPYAIGSIALFAHDGNVFTVLDVDQLGSVAHQNLMYNPDSWGNERIGFFKVSIREANDRRISFYPYGAVAEIDQSGAIDTSALYTLSVDSDRFDSVGISSGKPCGSQIAVLEEGEAVGRTDYNAIIEVDSAGRIRKVFSFHDQILGDIDLSGAVDISDAVLLFQHSMLPDLYHIEYSGSLDFNKDGAVDISDAVLLFQYSMLPDLYPIS